MLDIKNLSTGFQKSNLTLHQNITVQVNAGSLVLLIGPNGIGKSVFLKTVCGLQAPLNGSVIINETNIHKTSPEKRAELSSILIATPPQIEQMSVYEMVLSGRQRFLTGWRNPSQTDITAVQNAIQKTGIEAFQNKAFGSLSDGVKQKVMLSRCLAQNSQLILLDEPLAFLDYPSRIAFLELLIALAKSENKTIIYSSHDLQLSLNYCHSVIALTHQKFQYINSPEAVVVADIFSQS